MDQPAPPTRVLVAGATGYLGRRLVGELVAAGCRTRCLARTPAKLDGESWRDEVQIATGDVLDVDSLHPAMQGVQVAYYLVHSIGSGSNWQARDRQAAENFRDAAAAAGVDQIVYLGGLGDSGDALSPHLRSRHEVGETLRAGVVPVTELRAAVVIGSGSASFEMLRHLVEVLPIMTTPRWVETRVQPIAVRDVLAYLVGVLHRPDSYSQILEVGGSDVVTYRRMMEIYAEEAGLPRRVILPVPVLSPRLSSLWVGLVTPIPPSLARPLIDSLVNEVVVSHRHIDDLVDHRPMDCRTAIQLALRRVEDLAVTTHWTDAELHGRSPADPMPADPTWSGGTILADEQTVFTHAPAEAVYAVVCGLGGDRGWPSGQWMWRVRGWLDRAVGGVGLRRGRRDPDDLRVGDVLDFWRVEALEAGHRVRLRAEMKLPGEAWLEWIITEDRMNTRLDQRARFHPRGLFGRAYWYALLPFHRFVFRPMAQRIAAQAELTALAPIALDVRRSTHSRASTPSAPSPQGVTTDGPL